MCITSVSMFVRCLDSIRTPCEPTAEERLDSVTKTELGDICAEDLCLLVADPTHILSCGDHHRFVDVSEFEEAMDKVHHRHSWAVIRTTQAQNAVGFAIRTKEARCPVYTKRFEGVRRFGVRVRDASGKAVRKPLGRFYTDSDVLVIGASRDLLPEGKASVHFPESFDLEHTVSSQHHYQFLPGVGLLVNVPAEREVELMGLFTREGLTEIYVDLEQ